MEKFDIEKFKPKSNIYIEASAGTGKTYTIQQIVAKLINNGDSLDKILLVTYTEKAAGELRDKIRQKITEVIKNGTSNIECFERALQIVDTAPIHTIHSFCQKTLDEFAFDANRPYKMDLIDEGQVGTFVDKWIRDELPGLLEQNYKNIYTNDIDAKILGKEIKGKLVSAIKSYYLDNKNWAVVESIVSFDDKFKLDKLDSANDNVCKNYLEVSQEIYDSADYAEKKEKAKKVFKDRNNADYEKNKKEFYKQYLVKQLTQIVYKDWIKDKSSKKKQSYNDMIRSVREAVCDSNSQLKAKLMAKYTYAIIDEFQDTNQIQWDIFKTVFLDPEDHFIYVVGDPKQSIYAFQGADVNVYKKATEEIKNGYKLDTNYRSTDAMVDSCNKLFSQASFFQNNLNNGLLQFSRSNSCGKIKNATFEGKDIDPFWIAYSKLVSNAENADNADNETPLALEDESPKESSDKKRKSKNDTHQADSQSNIHKVNTIDFAAIVAEAIIDCCTRDKNNKTKLQIFDRDSSTSRNVSFKDFAILARTRDEMSDFMTALTRAGIPYLLYKDKKLFDGMECGHWISLLKAIETSDFTGMKREILSNALYTPFFDVTLDQIGDSKFDDPADHQRKLLSKWHGWALKRDWSKMVESILRETKIEEKYASLDKMQSMIKFRQIANYIINYLTNNNCDLSEVICNMEVMSRNSDEDDDKIVAIGTDFDCVQFMTIHASKGLEFPVVIMAGGKSNINTNFDDKNTYLYHDENKDAKLNPGRYGHENYKPEIEQEAERLFYVGLTRARSIMMMAYYGSDKMKSYSTSLVSYIDNNSHRYLDLVNPDYNDLKKQTLKILNASNQTVQNGNVPTADDLSNLSGRAWSRHLGKHSYSSLSHGKKSETVVLAIEATENEEEVKDKDRSVSEHISLKSFDEKGIFFKYAEKQVTKAQVSETYPRGADLGSALHEVFELADYANIGATLDDAKANEELKKLIIKCFRKYGLKVDETDEKKWIEQSVDFVWNTLNAKLPEIVGNAISQDQNFILKEGAATRLAEVEFNMDVAKDLKNYLTGSIDLLFVHQVDGKDVYSVLDWKSDSLDPEIYGNSEKVKETVDDRYSIQRVLYAYSVVKWLKQYKDYEKMNYEDIFNNHFGGVYYIFLRATEKDEFSGTYSHTWESWKDLEDAYKKINDKLIGA